MRPIRSLFGSRVQARNQVRKGPDRRVAFRYPTACNTMRLAWWIGEEPHETVGWITNLSTTGALFRLEVPPPIDAAASFRMEWPTPSAWFPGRVVRLGEGEMVGFHFDDGCPYDLYRSVAEGVQLTAREVKPSELDMESHRWR
jgi:hypothetical protein